MGSWDLRKSNQHHDWVAACVKMDPRLARKRGTGQEWERLEGRYQVYPEGVDELVGRTTFPVCPFEA